MKTIAEIILCESCQCCPCCWATGGQSTGGLAASGALGRRAVLQGPRLPQAELLLFSKCHCFPLCWGNLCHRIVFWTILSSLCVTPSRFKVLWGSGPSEAISLCVRAHGHVSVADRLADIRRVKPVLLASAVIGSALHFSLQFWAVNIYLRGSFWWKSVGIHLFSVWQHWGSLFLSFFLTVWYPIDIINYMHLKCRILFWNMHVPVKS